MLFYGTSMNFLEVILLIVGAITLIYGLVMVLIGGTGNRSNDSARFFTGILVGAFGGVLLTIFGISYFLT